MRFTIIDQSGAISFVGDNRILDAMVAACACDPQSYTQLLDSVDQYDKRVRDYVLSSLAVFDEHNTPENMTAIHAILRETRGTYTPPFRVLDELTRQSSLQPVRSGLVIFNLRDRRIVQVQNSYRDVVRTGAVQLHDGRRWTRMARRYEVPDNWSIVP
jgi:hypothetical protein